MRNETLVVIPARYGSTRFEGKVLAPLKGRMVVEWCHRAAVAAAIGPVVVATEDARVARAVAAFGGRAVMTSARCVSGTDRVFEAAKRFDCRFILNLQGDEPLIKSSTLKAVAGLLRGRTGAAMSTAVVALRESSRAHDPNLVKAVVAQDGRALYFSRAPIPFPRGKAPARYFQHIGIYGFTRSALARFVRLPPSPLEKTESLEQLRALEDGMPIYAAVVADRTVAIDTPEDLLRANKVLNARRK